VGGSYITIGHQLTQLPSHQHFWACPLSGICTFRPIVKESIGILFCFKGTGTIPNYYTVWANFNMKRMWQIFGPLSQQEHFCIYHLRLNYSFFIYDLSIMNSDYIQIIFILHKHHGVQTTFKLFYFIFIIHKHNENRLLVGRHDVLLPGWWNRSIHFFFKQRLRSRRKKSLNNNI